MLSRACCRGVGGRPVGWARGAEHLHHLGRRALGQVDDRARACSTPSAAPRRASGSSARSPARPPSATTCSRCCWTTTASTSSTRVRRRHLRRRARGSGCRARHDRRALQGRRGAVRRGRDRRHRLHRRRKPHRARLQRAHRRQPRCSRAARPRRSRRARAEQLGNALAAHPRRDGPDRLARARRARHEHADLLAVIANRVDPEHSTTIVGDPRVVDGRPAGRSPDGAGLGDPRRPLPGRPRCAVSCAPPTATLIKGDRALLDRRCSAWSSPGCRWRTCCRG